MVAVARRHSSSEVGLRHSRCVGVPEAHGKVAYYKEIVPELLLLGARTFATQAAFGYSVAA